MLHVLFTRPKPTIWHRTLGQDNLWDRRVASDYVNNSTMGLQIYKLLEVPTNYTCVQKRSYRVRKLTKKQPCHKTKPKKLSISLTRRLHNHPKQYNDDLPCNAIGIWGRQRHLSQWPLRASWSKQPTTSGESRRPEPHNQQVYKMTGNGNHLI